MQLSAEQLAAIRQFDTCRILNAIETFHIRLRTEGYVYPGLRCFGGRLLGYAVTARIKGSHPPPTERPYLDRTDWWAGFMGAPGPLIAVIQDIDERPGMGAVAGEIHGRILQRLNCEGLITNGAVRDLPALAASNFPVFAASVTPSHGYVHVVDWGGAVEIHGLAVQPGDLLYGDRHGVISIPLDIAAELPRVAKEQREKERGILALCDSPEFSLERIRDAVK
jgi:4-hydroxy-4-methyl-2-oxoglutarate aldolase